MTNGLSLTDEFLYDFFGKPKEGDKFHKSFHYAIQPYGCIEEYQRDNNSMKTHNTPSNNQDDFLLIMAAKLERTDTAIIPKRLRKSDIYGGD